MFGVQFDSELLSWSEISSFTFSTIFSLSQPPGVSSWGVGNVEGAQERERESQRNEKRENREKVASESRRAGEPDSRTAGEPERDPKNAGESQRDDRECQRGPGAERMGKDTEHLRASNRAR